jgi:hypothetical protein
MFLFIIIQQCRPSCHAVTIVPLHHSLPWHCLPTICTIQYVCFLLNPRARRRDKWFAGTIATKVAKMLCVPPPCLSVCLSVCPSAFKKLEKCWLYFCRISYWGVLLQLVYAFQFLSKWTKTACATFPYVLTKAKLSHYTPRRRLGGEEV